MMHHLSAFKSSRFLVPTLRWCVSKAPSNCLPLYPSLSVFLFEFTHFTHLYSCSQNAIIICHLQTIVSCQKILTNLPISPVTWVTREQEGPDISKSELVHNDTWHPSAFWDAPTDRQYLDFIASYLKESIIKSAKIPISLAIQKKTIQYTVHFEISLSDFFGIPPPAISISLSCYNGLPSVLTALRS